MNKNKVVVHLMGRDYTLVTDQQPDKVQRLSRYVDRRMRELAILTRAGENMLPVLTAMTLADETQFTGFRAYRVGVSVRE